MWRTSWAKVASVCRRCLPAAAVFFVSWAGICYFSDRSVTAFFPLAWCWFLQLALLAFLKPGTGTLSASGSGSGSGSGLAPGLWHAGSGLLALALASGSLLASGSGSGLALALASGFWLWHRVRVCALVLG